LYEKREVSNKREDDAVGGSKRLMDDLRRILAQMENESVCWLKQPARKWKQHEQREVDHYLRYPVLPSIRECRRAVLTRLSTRQIALGG